mmetsp:Transcript_10708/g.26417  ORF Transcript_10708/g.26417 Transcript_10708/m.26417 type:complete len:119 (-) Transcript_10708:650-1006(-)
MNSQWSPIVIGLSQAPVAIGHEALTPLHTVNQANWAKNTVNSNSQTQQQSNGAPLNLGMPFTRAVLGAAAAAVTQHAAPKSNVAAPKTPLPAARGCSSSREGCAYEWRAAGGAVAVPR